jgi:asparagine synthase (glutamine-hydrolysing)
MLVDDDGIQQWFYWNLCPSTFEGTFEDAAGEIRELLEKSVKDRLMADVPVGAFLSGGLDSSTIVGIMSQQVDDLHTYSIGFNDDRFNESPEAELVADHFGTNHQTISVDLSSMDLFSELIAHNGEPLADPAALPTLLLSQRANEDVKVVLTGSGADEIFGGYGYYRLLSQHRKMFDWMPEVCFRLANALADNSPVGSNYFKHFGSLASDEQAYLQSWRRSNVPVAEFINAGVESELLSLIEDSFPQAISDDTFQRISAYDLKHYVPDNLLYLVDSTTMAASIEGRVPFLDHKFVEFTYGVPPKLKTNGEYKPLLREAVSDLLPERTLNRSKQAFNVPIGRWFREDHASIDRWLSGSKLDQLPYVDRSQSEQIWSEHRSGNADHPGTLWRLLNYSAWYHTYVT